MNIIASQQGARENYNMAKALCGIANNFVLYTDFFNKAPYNKVFKNYNHRYNADIKPYVKQNPLAFFTNKLLKKNQDEIDEIYDAWLAKQIRKSSFKNAVFFTYSYNCNKALKAAKEKGYKCIMGQINPGPKEAEMVEREYLSFFPNEKFSVPNSDYWKQWKLSLAMVDLMIVNSEWSKNQLIEYFPEKKIHTVPLVANSVNAFKKNNINDTDSLKFVYAGAISVRKGFYYVQQALKLVKNSNFELHIVGRLNGPKSLLDHLPSNVFYHGQKSHDDVLQLMKSSDVFINPTLSDGFALTQLEAAAAGLASIFTQNCAKVYSHAVNGLEIEAFSAESLAEAIDFCIENPYKIEEFKSNLPDLNAYSLPALEKRLEKIVDADITRS